MKLSQRDMDRMASDIRDIISDWAVSGIIRTPLPPEQQPNWDPIMHEVVGDMISDIQQDVPVEIRAKSGDNQMGVTMAGDKVDQTLSLQVSDQYDVTYESIITLEAFPDIEWRVVGIRAGVGENIIQVRRLDGDS